MMLPPSLHRSLSARLLLLTALFVMLAEVLIFAPSVARFRYAWLEQRLAEAHLAALAVEAAPNQAVDPLLQERLLDQLGAHAVELIRPDRRVYMLGRNLPPQVEAGFVLSESAFVELIVEAFAVLVRGGDRVIKVSGRSPRDPVFRVEMVLNEAPLRREMLSFAGRIFVLSLVISLMTAGLVFFSLQRMLVRPMQQITRSILAFHRNPFDRAADLGPGRRGDEIGLAQRALAAMQEAVRTALRQQERLVALGTGVTKINHDLRGILATATLVSEILESSEDPEVKRITPRLIAALNRAVDLCSRTLTFAHDGIQPLQCAPVALRSLVDEIGVEVLAAESRGAANDRRWVNRIPEHLAATVDRTLFFRAIANLVRNALQAGATTVIVDGESSVEAIRLRVEDDGPGLPAPVREQLFQPFAKSGRAGGSGLGLAIARELVRAHGGDLQLSRSDSTGTVFSIDLPAQSGAA